MSNVTYSFVDTEGSMVLRSTVNSFGLDHVTDKDMNSFYSNFSQYSHLDTGLLPVDGSGLLSLRTAGNHTQIAYQHAPGMYYINWGQYEGDRDAVKWYVAQPYRIVIADIMNGNLLGARTFYSTVPITHPDIPLYHVNLPNINCKGYRGNGVGWICLYHTDDITSYPLSEKISYIIDRCSGTEAYNDQNMSETDGPRFYRENDYPTHTYDPSTWQSYSSTHGVEWTLDSSNWIPVLVQDIDHQDRHSADGIPLTFASAILGDYQAYYTDPIIPKPINIISRPDRTLSADFTFKIFKIAYNSSQTTFDPHNVYADSLSIRESNSLKQPTLPDPEYTWYCEDCSEHYTEDDQVNQTYGSDYICNSCFEQYTYCINTEKYHYHEDTLYLGSSDCYIYLDDAVANTHYKWCCECDRGMYHTHPSFESFKVKPGGYCYDCSPDEEEEQFPDEEPF